MAANWSSYQNDIFAAIAAGKENIVIEAVAGSGKCLGAGTPVLLFDGSIKSVETVVVGDLLMGPDSRPRTVQSVCHGTSPLYRITPVKGDSWVCNNVHVMTLVGTNRKQGQTTDIPLCDHLANTEHLDRIDRDWKLWRTGVEFPERFTEIDPYIVGVWLGDGTFDAPCITTPDQEIIDACEKYAASIYKDCAVTEPTPGLFTVRFRMGPRGVTGRDTPHTFWHALKRCRAGRSKFIPDMYKINSRVARLQLLAGLLDTDGYQHAGCYEIVTKYPRLRDDILYLARSLGFAAYNSVKYVMGLPYQRISISGGVSVIPLRVARKRACVRTQSRRTDVTGWSATQIGDGEYFGFTLDGDGRFLLGDFTVTHNTTTIVEACKIVNRTHGVTPLFLAFNKSIAKELGERGVNAKTLHSLGYAAWRAAYPRCQIDKGGRKVAKACDDVLVQSERSTLGPLVKKLVGYAKNYGIVPGSENGKLGLNGCAGIISDTDAEWENIIAHHGMEVPSDKFERIIQATRAILRISLAGTNLIDFADMLYMPVVYGTPFQKEAWVFVDEAQDVSRIQLVMLERCVGSRIVAVGDPYQAIYGFRGADSEALSRIKSTFNARSMALSITYRCAKNIVSLAQELCPHIEAKPGAADGTVETLQTFAGSFFQPTTDMIVCRNAAPLVKMAYRMIAARVPVQVLGRDIGTGLITLIDSFKCATISDLRVKLSEWTVREIDAANRSQKPEKIESITDKVDCIWFIADTVTDDSVSSLKYEIESLFSDDAERGKLPLSTVHKAKGLESERVFILDRHLMPSKYAKLEWQQEQERNVEYVAITRAKSSLFFIKSDVPAAKGEPVIEPVIPVIKKPPVRLIPVEDCKVLYPTPAVPPVLTVVEPPAIEKPIEATAPRRDLRADAAAAVARVTELLGPDITPDPRDIFLLSFGYLLGQPEAARLDISVFVAELAKVYVPPPPVEAATPKVSRLRRRA